MAVNEQIVTGRKFRKLMNETTKLWQRISFWTKSSDVEFNDGKSAETKLGAINGITSDLSCEDSSIAASAAALNQVNRSLNGLTFGIDSNGNYGYRKPGADTVTPFKSGKAVDEMYTQTLTFKLNSQISGEANWYAATNSLTFDFPNKVVGVVSGEVKNASNSWIVFRGGYVVDNKTVKASVSYPRTYVSTATIYVTAIGY